MKPLPAGLIALGMLALAACESAGEYYDGVSRFAGASQYAAPPVVTPYDAAPYYGPGSPPRDTRNTPG